LHPEFITLLYRFADIAPQDYWLTTNGTRLSAELAEALVDIPLTKLCVSLDAASAETYKAVRGGDYDKVIANVTRFLEIREKKGSRLPFLRVTFVEQDINRHEIDLFREKWENTADIVDIQKQFDFSVILKDISALTPAGYGGYDCIDPYYHLVIRHDGQLLPCCLGTYETDMPVYLKDIGISDYWNSRELLSFVQTIRDKRYIDCCKRCMSSIKV
jgi:MoaA/NifB/PqqE/SkfB family radical SAM enzyme